MNDTCKFEKCPIAKRINIKVEHECPLFMENSWVGTNNQKKITKDCVNVRMMLLVLDLNNRVIAIHKNQQLIMQELAPLMDAIRIAQSNQQIRIN